MKKMFAVRDAKSACFVGEPTFEVTEGVAMRNFADACMQEQHPFFRHPEDFALFVLAEFDELTGAVYPEPQPRSVMTAMQAKELRVS